jgi:toxin ParE1/3/4
MKIFWSEKALMDLEEIFDFYEQLASYDVAQKILNQLIEKVDVLVSYPEMGTIEYFDKPQPFEYRYILEGNHKLIYRVSEIEKLIFIARVFDTRKSPKKKDP